ncbi:MAG: purine phosphorylase [Verrucomicrobia bacterium TMED71]|nr:MAG: purine phosphorylase [Verrucomicrobia bacterium TMED71]
MNLAIISGTSINRSVVFKDWKLDQVETPYGTIDFKRGKGIVVVNRHGFSEPLPPHRSNYRGYVSALKALGVDAVIAVTSVGSLKENLKPGTLVSCSDYVSFAPMTFIDDRPSGFAPAIDNGLLNDLRRLCSQGIESDRVYVQTRGPRFETKAEVRILQSWGCDVVGMTFGNEADLLLESGVSLTSLCMIDNYAHGIGDQKLSMSEFHDSVDRNQSVIDGILSGVTARFGK